LTALSKQMRHLVVTRTRGPAWDHSRPLREQTKWTEHAAFTNGLVDEEFIVMGGPLGDGHNTLLIVRAEDEDEIRSRLDDDP